MLLLMFFCLFIISVYLFIDPHSVIVLFLYHYITAYINILNELLFECSYIHININII